MIVRKLVLAAATTLGLAGAAQAQTLAAQPADNMRLEAWLATFNTINVDEGKGVNIVLIDHLNTLNQWIQSTADIEIFRNWPNDDAVVRGLVPLAGGDLSETRVPATLVLGNVVDNTNVCHVIAHLARAPDINASGRINLLQVVRQVARYAFQDTAGWMAQLVEEMRAAMGAQGDVSKTMGILDAISERLASRTNGQLLTLRSFDQSRFTSCIEALPESYRTPEDVAPLFPDTIADLTIELIRERLSSEQDHREYATHLATLFDAADDAGKVTLVEAVIGAIIPPKEDPARRYRINLYVAVTFTRMAAGAVTTDAQKQALLGLRDNFEYGFDDIFKQNVDQAIEKQQLGLDPA